MKTKKQIEDRLAQLYKEHVQENRKYQKGKIRKAIEELEWSLK